MTVHAIDRWSGGACPFEAGWRKVMMWSFIVTDGLLFAGFLASYGFARTMSAAWPDQAAVFTLPFITLMTFMLITSSATMASAVWAAQHDRRDLAARFVWLTLLGGIAFLGMQAFEWAALIGDGVTLATNPWGDPLFGAYFFVTTGFHGAHRVDRPGCAARRGARGRRRPHPDRQRRDGRPVLALRRSGVGIRLHAVLPGVRRSPAKRESGAMTATRHSANRLRSYWAAWGVLLVLTLVMVVLDRVPLPPGSFLALVIAAMLAKATLIAGAFMHLRFERRALVAMIVVGLLLNAVILFGLILPDAIRIVGMGG